MHRHLYYFNDEEWGEGGLNELPNSVLVVVQRSPEIAMVLQENRAHQEAM